MFFLCQFVDYCNYHYILSSQAMELNGEDLLGRAVRLDFARERGAYTPYDRYYLVS